MWKCARLPKSGRCQSRFTKHNGSIIMQNAIQYSDFLVFLIMTLASKWDTIPIEEAAKRLSST